MLIRDPNTGALHEIPDPDSPDGVGEVVYDGFGNPVGLLPGLIETITRPIQSIVSRVIPRPPAPPAVPAAPAAAVTAAPGVLPALRSVFPLRRYQPPVGWVTPALPYTGMAPRRMYLRCSVWPGPAGLVPATAAMQPGVPAGTIPSALPAAAAAPPSPGRFRRRFRRRR